DKLPPFGLQAVVSLEAGPEFTSLTDKSYDQKGLGLFPSPVGFTLVCPPQIAEFRRGRAGFPHPDAPDLRFSTDPPFLPLAWRKQHPDLKALPFPMLADTKRELSQALGIVHKSDGVPLRATFIVDPEGVIRWVSVNDLSVGRNVDEVLRTLDALQTDELCPCNWKKGDPTLEAA